MIDTGPHKLDEQCFGIATIRRHDLLRFAMVGKSEQSLFGNGVDGVRRRKRIEIKCVGGGGILGAGAGSQQALR